MITVKAAAAADEAAVDGDDDDGACRIGKGGYTVNQEVALRYITMVSGLLSVIGCLFIAVTYYMFPSNRSAAYRVILMLALCNGLGGGAYFGQSVASTVNCKTRFPDFSKYS